MRLRRCLGNAISSAHIVQEQIRKERHALPIEQRVPRRLGLEDRRVTRSAANLYEHLFGR